MSKGASVYPSTNQVADNGLLPGSNTSPEGKGIAYPKHSRLRRVMQRPMRPPLSATHRVGRCGRRAKGILERWTS